MKRLFFLGVALLFFAGTFVYLNVQVFTPEQSSGDTPVEKQDAITASLKDSQADSDKDGLLNWEEELYGTSKKHADSDGDGVSDGEEVAQGKDPTVYGDYRAPIRVINEETDTYEFAQESNPQSIEEVMENVGKLQSDTNTTQNTTQNQSVLSSADIELKQCLNTLGSIVQNALVISVNDAAVLNNFINNETSNTYPVESLAQAVSLAAGALVPFRNAQCASLNSHVSNLQASYQNQEEALREVLKQESGSTEQYEAWQRYAEAMSSWSGVISDISDMVNNRALQLQESEPGYLFVRSL